MSREVEWRRRALDDLREIRRRDQRLADRIGAALESYALDDRGDVRKLAGAEQVYRLRVGDWRIIFLLEDGGRVMGVLRIVNRRDAYRD